jgi:hypothetical protein
MNLSTLCIGGALFGIMLVILVIGLSALAAGSAADDVMRRDYISTTRE